jgi:hypothetical protein
MAIRGLWSAPAFLGLLLSGTNAGATTCQGDWHVFVGHDSLDASPPPSPDAHVLKPVYLSPRLVRPIDPARRILLTPGAVLAQEVTVVAPRRSKSESMLPLPPGLASPLPTGSIFIDVVEPDGRWACTASGHDIVDLRSGNEARFCVADTDGDSRYDVGRLGEKKFPMMPFALRVLSQQEIDGRSNATFHRRLEVASIEPGHVTIDPTICYAAGGGLGEFALKFAPKPQPIVIPLRPGATASFGGVLIRLQRGSGGWWASAEGAYDPPIRLHDGATAIAAGGFKLTPRAPAARPEPQLQRLPPPQKQVGEASPSSLTPLTDMEAPGAPRRLFEEPRITRLVSGDHVVPLVPGTVLARHRAVVLPAQLTNPVAIPLPDRLGGKLPRNSTFVRQSSPAGESACLTKTEEPRDPASGDAVHICLYDSDGDGRQDRLIVGKEEPRTIAPLQLRPLAPGAPARVAPVQLTFIIRIDAIVDGRVRLTCGAELYTGGGQRRYVARRIRNNEPNEEPRGCTFDLPLQEGAKGDFMGITVRVIRGPGGEWRLAASGTAEWLRLRHGKVIDAYVIQIEMI